jgi:phosphoribosylformylglycinamidine synthase
VRWCATPAQFVCQEVCLRVEETDTPFTCETKKGQLLKLPIKHGEDATSPIQNAGKAAQQSPDTPALCRRQGEASPSANPNGSLDNIAGSATKRNVFDLMPHPEDA